MKLDIGSAECPMEPYEEWIHLDLYKGLQYSEQFELKHVVDVQADAHRLPFADCTFDEIFAGAVLLIYTGTKAVEEAVRVTKVDGLIRVRSQLPNIPQLIEQMNYLECCLHGIEEINADYEPSGESCVFDVMLTYRKHSDFNWGVFGNPAHFKDHPEVQYV